MMKHILCVGATSGLGKVFADMMRADGHWVSIFALGSPTCENHFSCDLRLRGAVEIAVEQLRKAERLRTGHDCTLDGIAFFQRLRQDGVPSWDGEISVQLDATYQLVEMLKEDLVADSALVFVASTVASLITKKASAGYHVAKAGLVQLMRWYAAELGPRGIRANAVCPSTFLKPENEAYFCVNAKARQTLAKVTALGRMGTAAEVARAIRFLLSEEASFITGQALVVDGGVSLRWQEDLAQ